MADGENIMQCPHCNVTLMMADRQGIEIDYCPQCRGVWLDRGELDKIIERSAPQAQPQPASPIPSPRGSYYDRGAAPGHWSSERGYGHGKPYKKRKSWLEEIFD